MREDATGHVTQQAGSCHCRRVRFSVSGDPKFVTRCHCDSCRRTTGAAFSTWAGFTAEQVRWQGDPPAVYASSPGVRRKHCSACGTPLSFESDRWPGEVHFLIGVFADPAIYTPSSDYQKDEALPWIAHWKEVK